MKFVEQHIIKKANPQFVEIDQACYKSKNLYNSALYVVKQEYLKTGKWVRYHELDKLFKTTNQENYKDLSNNSSQQTLMLLDKNIKAFFQAHKTWKTKKDVFTGEPNFPKYKHKTTGRNILVYTYQQIGYKNGYITFPKKEGIKPLKTNISIDQIKQVRFIPKCGCYSVEVVYQTPDIQQLLNNEKYLSVDIGVNNLATCVSTESKPFIINGRPLKSINQYYNKRLSKLKSQLKKNHNKYSSNRTEKLTFKRNNKVKDYIHKASKKIVQECVDKGINTIVVGKNDGWKKEINIGKRNNQNFVSIPFDTFVEQIRYKSERQGLRFVEINESYTSKCSSLDLEEICKHENYIGKRVKRGLFRSGQGVYINADVNGAYNILRKVSGDSVMITSRGTGIVPVRLNIQTSKVYG